MSNNKQSMKLYTEKQLKQIFVTHYFITDKELEELTPIELPSDDEIKRVINPLHGEMDDFDLGFRNGVQWLRDKIQGGNNEQQ